MIGKTIGRFRIEKRLGQGGMATVWRAHDELQDRTVAVKLLKEELADQPGARLRFEHEAKTVSLLDHPSIAAVYDWGEFEGKLYLAMTYVDGTTLSRMAKSRLLPVLECLRMVGAAADALSHAHERGIIHRDVTARNIMVATDGRVFVLDFGIALVADLTRLTTTGKIFGTAAYIAPEILLHKGASVQSDLYSLGVVLFEALTGGVPFEGERSEVLLYESLRRPAPAPSTIRPAVPKIVDQLTARLLSPHPEARYASAADLLVALQEASAAVESRTDRVPKAESSVSVRSTGSTVADSAETRGRPLFLGFLPVRVAPGGPPDRVRDWAPERLQQLVDAGAAAASVPNRVHVVPLQGAVSDLKPDALRAFGQTHGVNVLCFTTLQAAETSVRLTYRIVETESGVQIAGDRMAGAFGLPFELEDAFARSLRNALAAREAGSSNSARPGVPSVAAQDKYLQALGYLRRFDNEASLDGAISLLTELGERDPGDARFPAALARAYAHKHALTRQRSWEAQAVSACDAAVRLDPSIPEVTLARGEVDLLNGRWESAKVAFDELLRTHPDSYEGRVGRARAYHGLGQSELSETECQSAVLAAPNDWRAHHALAMIRFRRGEFDEAAESWRTVTELTPDNAGAHRNLGSALFHLDRLADAEAAFRRSIAMRPDAMAYSNLGTLLYFQQEYQSSVECFQHAVDINPADAMAWGNLGNACRLAGEPPARVEHALQRAVGLMGSRLEGNPAFGEGWAILADWYLGLGQAERSLETLQRALELAPDEARCQWIAAQVHAQLGDRAKALCHLRQAVRCGYRVDGIRRDPYFAAFREDAEFLRLLEEGTRSPVSRSEKSSAVPRSATRKQKKPKSSLAKGGQR